LGSDPASPIDEASSRNTCLGQAFQIFTCFEGS